MTLESQYPSIEIFRWKNLPADVYLSQHGTTVGLYIANVISPSIDALQRNLSELAGSEDPVAPFVAADLQDVLSASLHAFALSIQSLWERQFRAYLFRAAKESGKSEQYVLDVRRDSWEELCKKFEALKGIPVQAFDSYETLSLLQLIGNTCRHGDGYSANKLRSAYPELWPKWPPDDSGIWAPIPPPGPPSVEDLLLSKELLLDLATAVIWFWEDHEYIYTNSIVKKAPVVERTLEQWRNRRSAREFRELKFSTRR